MAMTGKVMASIYTLFLRIVILKILEYKFYKCTNGFFFFFSLVGILFANSGKALYKMDRDDLRDICGTKESVRLFSHLQKDRAQV